MSQEARITLIINSLQRNPREIVFIHPFPELQATKLPCHHYRRVGTEGGGRGHAVTLTGGHLPCPALPPSSLCGSKVKGGESEKCQLYRCDAGYGKGANIVNIVSFAVIYRGIRGITVIYRGIIALSIKKPISKDTSFINGERNLIIRSSTYMSNEP